MTVSNKEMAVFLKILGMLGSDFDGERATAGLKASEFLKSRNLQWSDVVGAPVQRPGMERERYRRNRYDPNQEPFDDEPEQPKARQPAKHVAVCLKLLSKYRHLLTAAEIEFVERTMGQPDLVNFTKLRLREIVAKVKAKR